MQRIIIVILTLALVLPCAFLLLDAPQIEDHYKAVNQPAPTAQPEVAKSYLESLTSAQIQPWLDRSQKLLTTYNAQTDSVTGPDPLDGDLQRLGVIRVDVHENQVAYVWVGGLNHTALIVDRLPDKSFKVTADFEDKPSKVLWP